MSELTIDSRRLAPFMPDRVVAFVEWNGPQVKIFVNILSRKMDLHDSIWNNSGEVKVLRHDACSWLHSLKLPKQPDIQFGKQVERHDVRLAQVHTEKVLLNNADHVLDLVAV